MGGNASVSKTAQSNFSKQKAAKRGRQKAYQSQRIEERPTFSAFIVAEVTISFKSLLRNKTASAKTKQNVIEVSKDYMSMHSS